MEKEINVNAQAALGAEQYRYSNVYMHTLEYAIEHGEVNEYKASRMLNMECKADIEETIRKNFDGMFLKHNIVRPLVEKHGLERMKFVLANTLRQQAWDGRFSADNKEWALEICITENNVLGMDMNEQLIINSHPAVLNGFVDMFRQEQLLSEESEEKSLFAIEMCGEKHFFENVSGLDPAGLIKLCRKCEKPFVEMARYGRQISTEESAAIEQGENFGFSIEFNVDDNEIRIFDGEKSEYMQLRERETEEMQEIPKAGRRR